MAAVGRFPGATVEDLSIGLVPIRGQLLCSILYHGYNHIIAHASLG